MKISNLKEVRSLLDMSQAEMARLIGVLRSHYSMIEPGHRSLAMKPLEKLAEIEKILHLAEKSSAMPVVLSRHNREQLEKEESDRRARLHKIGHDIITLTKRLIEMKKIYESVPFTFRAYHLLSAQECLTEEDHQLLEHKKKELEEKILRNGPPAQQKMEIQIHLLEMEQSILQQLTNNNHYEQNKKLWDKQLEGAEQLRIGEGCY